ncbi:MAG: hypothetical protein ACT4QG_20525 [Sporichthyaceae bacterium]
MTTSLATRLGGTPATYLLVIGDRAALGWILSSEQMAFPPTSRSEVRELNVGDQLLVYTTRGCFGNPTRDRGRVIGTAVVMSPVRNLQDPVVFGARTFPQGCGISVTGLVAMRDGVVLADHVARLAAFPNPKSWAVRLRRPLLRLPDGDARFLTREVEPMLRPRVDVLEPYLQWTT